MSGQDLLQVSYTLLCFKNCAEIILKMLCPFQSSWSPSQQIMAITVCSTASTAVQFLAQSGPCEAF